MFSLLNRRINRRLITKCKTQIKKISTEESKKQELRFNQNKAGLWISSNEDSRRKLVNFNSDVTKSKCGNQNEELDGLMAVFPGIMKDLTDYGEHINISEVYTQHYTECIRYILLNEKKSRGLTTVTTYKMLEKDENLTTKNMNLANIMGCIVELFQGFLMVKDNIIERRGHKTENADLHDIYDVFFLEQGMYVLLKKYFSDHRFYVPIMELYHKATLQTIKGQTLDSISIKNERPNFELFTMNKYYSLIKYKTLFYSFQFPVLLGMYMANVSNPEIHQDAKKISMKIGTLAHIQNDFLDCFGDSRLTSQNIQEGKLSWLAVVALQRANPLQKQIMEKYYGSSDPEAFLIIKNLFEELKLPKVYSYYEKESLEKIQDDIQNLPSELPQELFLKMKERFIINRDNINV